MHCAFVCGGSRIRTDDLWVMSPVSYHCSIPRFFDCKVKDFPDTVQVL